MRYKKTLILRYIFLAIIEYVGIRQSDFKSLHGAAPGYLRDYRDTLVCFGIMTSIDWQTWTDSTL